MLLVRKLRHPSQGGYDVANMAAQMIYLGDIQLRRISDDFVTVGREYAKLVAVFFTDGKDHPVWSSSNVGLSEKSTEGVTVRVINKIEDMTLKGTVAIDVAATAGPERAVSSRIWHGQMSIRTLNQSFRMARRHTMVILVHELRHVLKFLGSQFTL